MSALRNAVLALSGATVIVWGLSAVPDTPAEKAQGEHDKQVCLSQGNPWFWNGHACDRPCDYECVQGYKAERRMMEEYRCAMDVWCDERKR